MLNLLSKNVQNIIIKIILGLIVLVFMFWGFSGGYNTRTSVVIASVNGREISRVEHEQAYDRMLSNFKNQMKQFQGDMSNELLEKLNIRQRALDELIKKILLQQEAKNLNFVVNNKEIKDAIKNYPEFQENGRFSLERYMFTLKQNRIRPVEFENSRRDMLLLAKVENIITDSVQVSDIEALNEYKRRNEKVSINYLKFNPVDFKDKVEVTDDELKAYFNENAASFNIQPKVKTEILAFENDAFARKAEVTDDEIKDYYIKNKDDFIQDEEVKVSHILIKSTLGEDPQKRADAKKEAEEVLHKYNNGEDFALLARKYSHDKDTAMNNGYIGWIKRGKKDKAFEDAAFAQEPGTVSGVVEARDGFHIINVMDKKEEKLKELGSVEYSIKKKLALMKAKRKINELIKKARKEVFLSKNLAAYAKNNDAALLTPPPFALGEKVQGIGRKSEFNRQVFEVPEGDVSDIIELSRGSYIVKVIQKIPSKTPELGEVKEPVKEKVVAIKSKELAEEKANEALKKAQAGVGIAKISQEYGLLVELSENFPRMGSSAPKIGVSEELVNAAFGLSNEKLYPNKIFNVNNNFYLIRFVAKDEVSSEKFKKEKPFLLKQLRMEKANRVFASYIEGLVEKADIQIFQEL